MISLKDKFITKIDHWLACIFSPQYRFAYKKLKRSLFPQFLDWIISFPSEEYCGVRSSVLDCPVARFLREIVEIDSPFVNTKGISVGAHFFPWGDKNQFFSEIVKRVDIVGRETKPYNVTFGDLRDIIFDIYTKHEPIA